MSKKLTTREKAIRRARRELKIQQWIEDCSATVWDGRIVKKCYVPGTRESGEYEMLLQSMNDRANRYTEGL